MPSFSSRARASGKIAVYCTRQKARQLRAVSVQLLQRSMAVRRSPQVSAAEHFKYSRHFVNKNAKLSPNKTFESSKKILIKLMHFLSVLGEL